MRVNFDSQIFCAQAVGGISRYIASLAREMQALPNIQPRILAPYHCNEYLKALPDTLVYGNPAPRIPVVKPIFRIASLLMAGVAQRISQPAILHQTYYYPYCHLPGSARNIITVHDMIHEKYPQFYSAHDPIARWKKRAITRADQIICVSNNTRKDLLERYDGIRPESVSVTHLGCDGLGDLLPNETASTFRTRELGVDAPYILFVGHRAGYKNFSGLLEAYNASPWLKQNFYLLCFGGGGFSETEKSMIAGFGDVEQRIKQIGGPDSVLASCYRHASVFAYPSLYEGFGIPPLEAMSLDCPVACSHTSSIPEIVGNAAVFFDPTHSDSIRIALESILNSPSMQADLVQRGRIQKIKYSWRKCAEETVGIYRTTLSQCS